MSVLPHDVVSDVHRSSAITRGWIPDLLGCVGVLLAALWLGLRPFVEPDHWWHLRVGQQIRSTGNLVFSPDPWAAFADRDYIATQWLPEVAASWAYELGGMGALLWLRTLFIILIALAVYTACRSVSGPFASSLTASLALLASTASLNPRPQLVGFLLFAITVLAWREMVRDHRPRWWLVPLFWVWACSHGLWTFGLAVSALTLAGMFMTTGGRPDRAAAARLFGLVAACVLATGLSPLGPRLWLTPFDVAGNASRVVNEWQPTPFNGAAAIIAAVIVIVAIIKSVFQRARLWQLMHLALAVVCLFWMWRLVPLAVILAAPAAASSLGQPGQGTAISWPAAGRRAVALAAVAAVVLAGVISAGEAGRSASRYPADTRAVDAALDCLPAGDVVFTSNGLSGWLLWRHPDLTPVVDLRIEIYPWGHVQRYRVARDAGPGWQEFIRDTGSDAALLDSDSPLLQRLVSVSGWEIRARSAGGVLAVRPATTLDCPATP